MKRRKQLIIRVSLDEYHALLARKTSPCLATWMREICLGVKPSKPLLKVEPALLLSLAKIGGNLNQIAKHVNQNNNNISNMTNQFHLIDQIKIFNELSLIRDNLDMLLAWHIDREHLYASEDI